MASCRKVSNAHQKELYKRYATEQKWRKNKTWRLSRHLKNHPEDKQAETAYSNISKKTGPAGPRSPGNNAGTVKVVPLKIVYVPLVKTVKEQLIELGFRK